MCNQPVQSNINLLLNESIGYLYPNQKLIIYIADKWLRIDNLETNMSQTYDGYDLFRFSRLKTAQDCEYGGEILKNSTLNYLYVGFNRAIGDRSLTGSGVCNAKISFVNCYSNLEPSIDINVKEMSYINNDNQSIHWVHELNYLEPTPEHTPCSGQGVVKLTFEPNGAKKLARLDLQLGDIISGFTFNIGDSPTNNGYGNFRETKKLALFS